jgi:glycosyltransferase EpsE
MDCDDLSIKDRFEKQVQYLDHHKEIDIVGGAVYLFDEKGIYGLRRNKSKFNKVEVFKRSFFIHPTVMMRKNMFLSVNGYTVSKQTYRTEDYDLWCKICYYGFRGTNIDDVLLYYREDRNAYRRRKFR